MPVEDLKKLLSSFPKTNFIYSYGQTEASPRVTYIERNDLEQYIGSSGKCIRDVSIRIADENGKSVPAGECGEIVVKGPNVMYGYYKNNERTQIVKRNGELYTGDIGYLDENGYLFVKGRSDNMLITAGKNVYPEEIEGVASAFPGVNNSFVTSVSQSNQTLKLLLYISLNDNCNSNADDMLHYLKNNLENYKLPSEVYIVKDFARTSSNKISRKQQFDSPLRLL